MAVISRILGAAAALALASSAVASPVANLTPRDTVDSDALVGFAQTVPSGTVGDVYLNYLPFLKIVNGCVPFPAVDASGNTNGGLKPTGSTNGGCSSSTGQVYVRSATFNGYYAVMYSWYMPKDQPSSGIGHRHDWEGTIVWLKSSTATTAANIVAVCPSAHGDWNCASSGFTLSGTKPLIKYESVWPIDHSLALTTDVGGTQPLIAWESLPTVAQTALDVTDFGDANVPFNEDHFKANLGNCTW